MAITSEEFKLQLDQLTLGERAELAAYLLRTLDPETDADAEIAWERELARREAEIASGEVTGEPVAEVISRLRKQLS